jgi:hypothetical protein
VFPALLTFRGPKEGYVSALAPQRYHWAMIAPGAMVLFQPELKLVAQLLEWSFRPVDSGECEEVLSTAERTRFYSDVAVVIFEQFVLRGLTSVMR